MCFGNLTIERWRHLIKQLKWVAAIFVMLFIVACSDTDDVNEAHNAQDNSETHEENDANNTNEENETDATTKDADYEAIEREEVANVFLNGEFERLYHQTSKEFQEQVTVEQLEEIAEGFNEGVEGYVLQSDKALDDAMTQFTWVDEAETKGVIAVFNAEDTIEGFQVLPLDKYPETDDLFTETEFELPFENEWFVFWGGTNELVNYHYAVEEQRYAFDFLIRKDDRSYDGDPEENESYYAFGENMLAPADGVVVEVENDIADNEPVGEMNAEEPLGNYVIIEHENDAYGFLAHLKQGSVQVEEGDEVKANDVLGLVGNSGNSSEPHIHFHVADAPDIHNSTSIRINLADEELTQGDYVTP